MVTNKQIESILEALRSIPDTTEIEVEVDGLGKIGVRIETSTRRINNIAMTKHVVELFHMNKMSFTITKGVESSAGCLIQGIVTIPE